MFFESAVKRVCHQGTTILRATRVDAGGHARLPSRSQIIGNPDMHTTVTTHPLDQAILCIVLQITPCVYELGQSA
jgi:hypothetical protein